MRLLGATFLSIRGLPDMTVTFGDPTRAEPAPCTIVTGASSSGKTRLLEALVTAKEIIAPYGPPPRYDAWIRQGEAEAKIELSFLLDQEEARACDASDPIVRADAFLTPKQASYEADEAFVTLLERYDHDPARTKVDYLPAHRALLSPGPMPGISVIEQRVLRLNRDPFKYGFVPRYLESLGRDPEARSRFERALAMLSPTVRYVEPAWGDPRRCLSSRGGPAAAPSELSTTEAQALVVAASFCLARLEKSIVLIDRPELFAEDAGLPAFFAGLRELMRDGQLVLASRSERVLAAAGPSAIVTLDPYTQGGP
jgi:hypothetical protein